MNILILNQAFHPDVVSTAQHASDLAVHLTERGHRVTAVASSRGYDDPKLRLPKRETWKGVRIWRVSALGLGKKARWQRILNFASFVLSCSARLLTLRRFDVVVAMTSPPLISFIAALLVALKGGQLVCWVMDLNPDEALAAGWLSPGSATARWLAVLSRFSLRKARAVVALDRFMRDRLLEKSIPAESIAVLPPWSHDDVVRYDPSGRAAFREQHGLTGSFVVMYSGNHSPCHPLNTVLEAALRLANYSRVAFCFVGGGSEFEKVGRFKADHALDNVTCVSYQPLDRLAASLSAADLHLVVMGDPFVGIVHPCKIYNILTLGIPFLYVGPGESHVADLIASQGMRQGACAARNGDVETVVNHILVASEAGCAHQVTAQHQLPFSKEVLCTRMAEVLERAASRSPQSAHEERYGSSDPPVIPPAEARTTYIE